MEQLIATIAKGLVEDKNAVQITADEALEDGTVVYHLHVAQDDMGRVIGKGGRMVKSIKALFKAVAAKRDKYIKNYLEKVSLDNETILKINMEAIPAELSENYNSQHIGGISYYNGYIYAAVEDSKQWNHPLVVVFDANTLEFTGTFYEMSTERHTRGIPWLFVDGENGILYAGDSANYVDIFMYDLETMEYKGTLSCKEEIAKIQGGEYYNGKLYLGTNDITRAVYTVDCKTGEVEKLFDRIMYEYKLIDNLGGEGEGLTILPMDDGTLIHTLQVGTLFIDSSLRHYSWK